MAEPDRAFDLLMIGGGCASLSLARQAQDLPQQRIAVMDGKTKRQDHAWGFFKSDITADAAAMARKKWQAWQIITDAGAVTHHSDTRPYTCLESKAWLSYCQKEARQCGVEFIQEMVTDFGPDRVSTDSGDVIASIILDSRPHPIPDGMMIQHFIGHEVQVNKPVFDPDTAILMDFRCDQSRGIHFIYVLPFSPTQALVESTMFSPKIEEDAFYEKAIDDYLAIHCGVTEKIILRREQGAIPMGIIKQDQVSGIAIGGRGGAIRPSSGYAFGFIQKQIDRLITGLKNGRIPHDLSPHTPLDLWMDQVFLNVIRHHPALAPRLFHAMAKALTGDDMARFMSGDADHWLRLKVVMAMPKWPFLKAVLGGVNGR